MILSVAMLVFGLLGLIVVVWAFADLARMISDNNSAVREAKTRGVLPYTGNTTCHHPNPRRLNGLDDWCPDCGATWMAPPN
jgi:hypothetical protein